MKKKKFFKYEILNLLLVIIATIFFYMYLNIDYLDDPFIQSQKKGVSDISRYFNQYNNISLTHISNLKILKDPSYTVLTFILNNMGINFKKFMLIVIFFYYLSFEKILFKIINNKSFSFLFLLALLTISSFVMISIIGVALRQGIAFIILIQVFLLDEKKNLNKILLVLLATSFHLSAILFLPFILLENFFLKKKKLLNRLLLIFVFIYVLNVNFFSISINMFINFFEIDLRALSSNSTYRYGFSIYKFIASIIPIIIVNLVFKLSEMPKLFFRIYIFYCYSIILGIIFCFFPYHDRIFLFGWSISPLLIIYSLHYFLKN
jgi:hypothetical protein